MKCIYLSAPKPVSQAHNLFNHSITLNFYMILPKFLTTVSVWKVIVTEA